MDERSKMISRRGFFGLFGGMLAHQAARKIYVFAPVGGWNISPGEVLFFLPEKDWSYRYTYRNVITGHVSNVTPQIENLLHTFAYPEMDVLDIYRQLNDGNFQWHRAIVGYKG